jgi:phospholipase/lecithinase/hemolysin
VIYLKEAKEMNTILKSAALTAVLTLVLMASDWAEAITFKRIVVFGGSVSDSGNAFALTGIQSKPPYDQLDAFLIPTGPYSVGGHHSSNGATWIEQFARPLGLSRYVQPAFQGASPQAGNYAVAGARARDAIETVDFPEQVAAFLKDVHNKAPSDALYVIDFGGNDVRDALTAGDPGILADALDVLADNVATLYAAGARKFLFLTVANIGVLPSVRILDALVPQDVASAATALTVGFNTALNFVIGSLPADTEVAVLDVFQTVEEMIANPPAFGLTEVEDACITPNVRPFSCKRPDRFLFWDGIHPTKAVHAIFAAEAADILGE